MSVLVDTHPVSIDWEFHWAPYDMPTYQLVLEHISADDIVLEIGAGDLRLARQMADIAGNVYALEMNRSVLEEGLASFHPLSANLIPVCADARTFDFPRGITSGVLLMRHCTHFQLYAEKLREAGCTRLITNARWGMNVEVVDLQTARISYKNLELGWYACWCGTVGFKHGSPEKITPDVEAIIHEIIDCPNCRKNELPDPKFDAELSL